MRMLARLAVPGCLVALGLAGLIAAPVAAADCNDSSGTTVCAQGDIRATDGGMALIRLGDRCVVDPAFNSRL